jgi:protein-S-isoprenylcysteine O-methyltransferase Ste14
VLGGSSYFAHLVIACLDVGRFHWSNSVPRGLQVAALVLFAVSWLLATWAMAVNRFFSSVVRIQDERGHNLVTVGPYRYVRHPGYLGAIIGMPASAIALGSWWSLVPAAVVSLVVFRRLVVEDAFLKDHLDGYRNYMHRVRYRLLPGIW